MALALAAVASSAPGGPRGPEAVPNREPFSTACSATRAPAPSRTSASRRVRPFAPVGPSALVTSEILCPVIVAMIVPSGRCGDSAREPPAQLLPPDYGPGDVEPEPAADRSYG